MSGILRAITMRMSAIAVFAVMVLFSIPVTAVLADNAAPREHIVEIRAFKFVPAVLTVKTGDRIKWINRDIAPHTATAADQSWDTGELVKDASRTLTVEKNFAGTYFCRFHPSMKAALKITPVAR